MKIHYALAIILAACVWSIPLIITHLPANVAAREELGEALQARVYVHPHGGQWIARWTDGGIPAFGDTEQEAILNLVDLTIERVK